MKFTIIICLVCFSLLSCTAKNNKQFIKASKFGVVRACLDPSKHYLKISSIKSRTSYLEKAYNYHPIEHPQYFIPWDFSKDGYLDYIFIEKQQAQYVAKGSVSKIRLVICKSQIKRRNSLSYTRFYPKFSIYESSFPNFQVESHSIKKVKNTLILRRNYYEHNWGSDSTVNIYEFDKKVNGFKLLEQEIISSSGDGYRSDSQDNYDYKNGTLTKDLNCGLYTGPCKTGLSRYSFKSRIIKLSEQKDIFRPQVSQKELQANHQ